jgi:exodeoxyribonuclease V alpha subunit
MPSVSGWIVSASKNINSNGPHRYVIQCENMEYITLLKFNEPIMPIKKMHKISIDYRTKEFKGDIQNQIQSYKYINFSPSGNKKFIENNLSDIDLPKIFIDKLINKYGKDTLAIVLGSPDKIKSEIKYQYLDKSMAKIYNLIESIKKNPSIKSLIRHGIRISYHCKILCHQDWNTIKNNFYDMFMSGIDDFEVCDNAALMSGYKTDSAIRLKTYISKIFTKQEKMGNLFLTEDKISEQCLEDYIPLEKTLEMLIKVKRNDKIYYTSEEVFYIEREIERLCLNMKNTKFGSRDIIYEDNRLTENQKDAIKMSLDNGISIITGPPGSGKTTIIKEIIRNMHERSLTFVIAFTGSVVEKIKKDLISKGIIMGYFRTEVSTIHLFLEKHTSDGAYTIQIDEDNDEWNEGIIPVPIKKCHSWRKNKNDYNDWDEDIVNVHVESYHDDWKREIKSVRLDNYEEISVIIDEASMVDMRLMHRVLDKISEWKNVRLLMLGDVDQLPSIRAGNVLYDSINSGKLPVTILKESHRQDNRCLIDNAQKVINGQDINPDNKSVFMYNMCKLENILPKLIKKFELDSFNNCILTPINGKNPSYKNYEFGKININNLLQNYYNPNGEILHEITIGNGKKIAYRKGDWIV